MQRREARVLWRSRLVQRIDQAFARGCAMTNIRYALFGILAGAAVGLAPTSAIADGPAGRGPVRDAPVAYAPFSWGGLYVGVHAGYAWADVDWDFDYPQGLGSVLFSESTNNDGGFVGGHIGLQHQYGRWVVGGEVALSGGFDDQTIGVPLFFGDTRGTITTDIDWLVTATLRLGYSWDRWLGYVKGGYAGAMIRLSTDDNVPPDFVSSTRDMHHGWTVGAGLEYAITHNLVFGIGYNFVSLSEDVSASLLNETNGAFIGTVSSEVDTEIHSVMARLSLKFGRDEPMARPMK